LEKGLICLSIVIWRLTSISFSVHTQHPPLIESFQRDEVLPALDLPQGSQLTSDLWDQFLALDEKVEIRERIMRQTPWRKGEMGVEIGHLYTTLSAHIHDPKQGGDALVISKESSLTIEGCLGFAARLRL